MSAWEILLSNDGYITINPEKEQQYLIKKAAEEEIEINEKPNKVIIGIYLFLLVVVIGCIVYSFVK